MRRASSSHDLRTNQPPSIAETKRESDEEDKAQPTQKAKGSKGPAQDPVDKRALRGEGKHERMHHDQDEDGDEDEDEDENENEGECKQEEQDGGEEDNQDRDKGQTNAGTTEDAKTKPARFDPFAGMSKKAR